VDNLPRLPITLPDRGPEIIVDLFAGGGGASEGIRTALGRDPDVAINHDPEAIAMHAENHPGCKHYCQDVWSVSPSWATKGRPVALLWASPDCTHFSKAKGGQPNRDEKRRDLAWVIEKWAREVRPRTICMENVEEFKTWGPLRDGRPIKEAAGTTFRAFVRSLRRLGYSVSWRELRACDYGAPTIRKRFFLVAQHHGAVVWPEPTHGPGRKRPYRTAADCIDWSAPCPSIFERKKPLAEATCRRIAKGVMKYVVNNKAGAFIVNHCGAKSTHAEFLGCGLDDPVTTQTTGSRHRSALVASFLAKHYTGVTGSDLRHPLGTITTTDHHSLVAAHIAKMRGTNVGSPMDDPLHTISAGGTHHALVASFLTKYYGQGGSQSLNTPAGTVTCRDRFGLVTVHIAGETYVLTDIGMRMLQPRELYRAQGFPDSYVIDQAAGKPLAKKAQVRMCGNSVSPPNAAAIVRANVRGEMRQAVNV
jgi:DNA (cytosine-5)-methyltransferase 1